MQECRVSSRAPTYNNYIYRPDWDRWSFRAHYSLSLITLAEGSLGSSRMRTCTTQVQLELDWTSKWDCLEHPLVRFWSPPGRLDAIRQTLFHWRLWLLRCVYHTMAERCSFHFLLKHKINKRPVTRTGRRQKQRLMRSNHRKSDCHLNKNAFLTAPSTGGFASGGWLEDQVEVLHSIH